MSFENVKSKTLAIKNGDISYLEGGQGNPLILINGFTNHFRDWHKDFTSDLSESCQLFLPNNPGIGLSTSHRTEFSIEAYADDLTEWILKLNLGKVAVLGHSMGGYIAQEIARRIPEQLSALILSSSRMGGRFATPADPRVAEVLTRSYSSIQEEKEASLQILATPEYFDQIRVHRKSVEAEAAQHSAREVHVPEEMKKIQNNARLRWIESFGEKQKDYERFKFPTLILVGNEDRIIPPINGIELVRAFPNSWLLKYPKGGHALSLQFPIEISQTIQAFLRIKAQA